MWPFLVIIVVVLGGIYVGIFTVIEASGIGAFCTLIMALIRLRGDVRKLKDAVTETVATTCMVFFIIIGAMIFNKFLVSTGLIHTITDIIAKLPIGSYGVLVIIMLVYLVLGCLMDALAMLALTLPVFFPIISALGFDGIVFGILIVLVVEIGMITPPFGMTIFVVKAVVGDQVTLESLFRKVLPYFFGCLVALALLISFPQISLWLPGLAYK